MGGIPVVALLDSKAFLLAILSGPHMLNLPRCDNDQPFPLLRKAEPLQVDNLPANVEAK